MPSDTYIYGAGTGAVTLLLLAVIWVASGPWHAAGALTGALLGTSVSVAVLFPELLRPT